MPAILPSGPCAQVNPLFRAAPSAPLLAGWHASKTQSGAGPGRGNSFFLYLAQEIFTTRSVTAGRNVPEPAVLFQQLPLYPARPGKLLSLGFFFSLPHPHSSLQLRTARKVNKGIWYPSTAPHMLRLG